MASNTGGNAASTGGATAAAPCAAPGCSFFGSPGTLGLCSTCYKKTLPPSDRAVPSPAPVVAPALPEALAPPVSLPPAGARESAPPEEPAEAKGTKRLRCYVADCRKKLSVATAVECRCKNFYCHEHRMPFNHSCPVDLAKIQQDRLRAANPTVQQDKFERA